MLSSGVLNDLLSQRFERTENDLVRALAAWIREQPASSE
jgi:hypothetical protein